VLLTVVSDPIPVGTTFEGDTERSVALPEKVVKGINAVAQALVSEKSTVPVECGKHGKNFMEIESDPEIV
jgi:hypothetical protein